MRFEVGWTISSSYDFPVHQQHSQRGCGFPRQLYCNSKCSQTCCWCSQGLPGMLLALPGFSPALPGAPRCTQSPLRCSIVCPNLSLSLPWYSSSSHWRFQLLRMPAEMPSHSLILSWNQHIEVYTPDPLGHSWRPPVTNIHSADEWFWIKECRKRVRRYDGTLCHDEPHELHESSKLANSMWRTTQIAWIYESSARVHKTKTWKW